VNSDKNQNQKEQEKNIRGRNSKKL